MASFLFFVLQILICPGPARAQKQDEARRHLEKTGGFSLVPPDTWTVRDFPGLKYKVIVGPTQAGFASNIVVADETFKGTLDDYVKANKDAIMQVLKKAQIVKQEEFKTTDGLPGVRLIFENEQGDKLLRRTSYFFGATDTKYVLTCSTLAEGGEKLDPVFEQALKTFRFEKK
jgi:hypothetical protein